MKKLVSILTLIFGLHGCADDGLHLQQNHRQILNWHRVATEDDRARFSHWRDNMIAALKAGRETDASAVDAAGPLLQPDSALEPVGLVPGKYRCQMLKLGAQEPTAPTLKHLPATICMVAAERQLLRFTMGGAAQRAQATLYPDNNRRMVLLGTTMLGDEAMAQIYGHDTTRDMIGIVERIGDQHWRILLPAPHFESLFDVIDITPVGA
jgi:hypothetical protein